MATNFRALFSAAATLTLLLGARPALAYDVSLAAFPGTPAAPSEAACWGNTYGMLVNNCSGMRRTCISVPLSPRSTPTPTQVTVNHYAATSANKMSCFAQGVDP